MPLLLAPLETDLIIKHVGGDIRMKKHLESLGIVPERTIRLLGQTKGGIIVLINDSRLALDREIANSIMVE